MLVKFILGMSESVIMLPDNYDPKVSKIVWKDENVPLSKDESILSVDFTCKLNTLN